MNPDEMLKALDLSQGQLHELLAKFSAFLELLDERQRHAVRRSLPTLAEAVAAFGAEVDPAELLKLFEGDKAHPPVMICLPGMHHKIK
jgi:hypothetical protein